MKLHAPTAEHRSPHRTSGRLGISLIAAAFVLVAGACSSGDDSSSSTTAEAGATDDAVAGSKELTIKFNDSALETIAETNQHVVVTRAAEDSDPSSAIAWTVFSPLESNSVTWTPNTVSVYASSSEDQNGAKLDVESSVDAQLGDTLKFNSDRTWTNTGSGGPTTGIEVEVADAQSGLGFGMESAVSVNDASETGPFSLSRSGPTQTLTLSPTDTVQVFLAANTESGTVVQVGSGALTVNLANTPSETIEYAQISGTFVVSQ